MPGRPRRSFGQLHARAGHDVHVLGDDDDPAELARSADAETLGVAGGDGSLAAVAAVAIQRDLPFDVLVTPIEFRISPSALRVLVPPGAEDV